MGTKHNGNILFRHPKAQANNLYIKEVMLEKRICCNFTKSGFYVEELRRESTAKTIISKKNPHQIVRVDREMVNYFVPVVPVVPLPLPLLDAATATAAPATTTPPTMAAVVRPPIAAPEAAAAPAAPAADPALAAAAPAVSVWAKTFCASIGVSARAKLAKEAGMNLEICMVFPIWKRVKSLNILFKP